MNFSELKINEKIKKALINMGFEGMMPIQEQTIPLILEGKNIIGEADTGTGKTASFVIPMLEKIDFTSGNTECLIVTPTRELAMQIVSEIEKIGKNLKFSYATLVGGMSIMDQARSLKNNPSIIVGTLGRINDHLRRNRLHLENVKFFVLDEADEMLKEGFKDDITAINECLPETKQTLLFSATISKHILDLSKSLMDTYEFVSVKDKEHSSVNIEQFYLVMKEKQKFSTLTKLLDIDKPESAIIFGRTKRRVDELNDALNKCGYKSVGIHGDLTQQQRNSVLKSFREGKIHILVATDVAARGLDISNVTHVYNFDLPQEVEFYVHRIGRTGRAKKHGVSYSFIKEGELSHIKRIEKEMNVTIREKNIPSSNELWESRNLEVKKVIEQRLSEIDTTLNNSFANELIEEYGSEKLVSVLIETLSKKGSIRDIALTGEPPVVTKDKKSFKKSFSKRSDNGNFRRSRKTTDKSSFREKKRFK